MLASHWHTLEGSKTLPRQFLKIEEFPVRDISESPVASVPSSWGVSATLDFYYCCLKITLFNVFRQHTFIILHFWRSEVLSRYFWARVKVSPGMYSVSDAPGKNPFYFFLLQLLQAVFIPWLKIFHLQNWWSLMLHHSNRHSYFFLHFMRILWVHWAHLDNPELFFCFKISWVVFLIPSATLILLCCEI